MCPLPAANAFLHGNGTDTISDWWLVMPICRRRHLSATVYEVYIE